MSHVFLGKLSLTRPGSRLGYVQDCDSAEDRFCEATFRCIAGYSEAQYVLLPQLLRYCSKRTAKPLSVITQCCIHELYLQGKTEQPAVDLAKTFERRKCNHREAIPGDDCLTAVIGASHFLLKCALYRQATGDSNRHRYVLASQSLDLRTVMRKVSAVPIVHVNRSVMILEPPSDATIRAKNAVCMDSSVL